MKKSRSLELAGASSNRWWLITLSGDPEVMGKKVFSPNSHSNRISKYLNTTLGRFIYILDSSNSSSFTFDLLSWLLALEATEPVSEPVTQMAVRSASYFARLRYVA